MKDAELRQRNKGKPLINPNDELKEIISEILYKRFEDFPDKTKVDLEEVLDVAIAETKKAMAEEILKELNNLIGLSFSLRDVENIVRTTLEKDGELSSFSFSKKNSSSSPSSNNKRVQDIIDGLMEKE